jgi:WD40 repeat protein
VFDVNGRFKSMAQQQQQQHPTVRTSPSAVALCCQPIHCLEWDSSRGFLVGYSDGSVVLWACRHYKETGTVRPLARTSSTAQAIDEEVMDRSEAYLSEASCLGQQPTPPSNKRTVERTAEAYLRGLLALSSPSLPSEETTQDEKRGSQPPSYEVLYRRDDSCSTSSVAVTSTVGQGTVTTEYLCLPILCLHSTVKEELAVTAVRLSSDWEYILAGRVDGTVVKWKIRET